MDIEIKKLLIKMLKKIDEIESNTEYTTFNQQEELKEMRKIIEQIKDG